MPQLIQSIQIVRYSIPMHPFTIATGTMHYAQNILLIITTNQGITGYGECSAFPMIVGETQNTCYAMAKDLAPLWIGTNALDITERMHQLHSFAAFNYTIKSAFDMALYDIAAQDAGLPLYAYLGGSSKAMVSDITVGISNATTMAEQAAAYVANGATILKVKVGKRVQDDVANIHAIRQAIGHTVTIRIDANQGWSYSEAVEALTQLQPYNIQLCEQPMRIYDDHYLTSLMQQTTIPIMADESVYTHYDAWRLISNQSCHSINIKLAKSGGIHEALKIIKTAQSYNIPCMMGGMLESRLALTACAHFAAAHNGIQYYDMDTCMLGHLADPVLGGVTYNGYTVLLPQNVTGIGATVDAAYIHNCESVVIS